jgi:hypothetical protein
MDDSQLEKLDGVKSRVLFSISVSTIAKCQGEIHGIPFSVLYNRALP